MSMTTTPIHNPEAEMSEASSKEDRVPGFSKSWDNAQEEELNLKSLRDSMDANSLLYGMVQRAK
jgi:hypothetical protein